MIIAPPAARQPCRRARVAVAAACLALGTVVLSGCVQEPEFPSAGSFESEDGTVSEWATSDREAPIQFSSTTSSGEDVDVRKYRGEVLVLNFWYASCPPCRVEADDLQALHEKWDGEGAAFLGVNLRDDAPRAEAFNREFGITYPSVLDLSDSAVMLAVSGRFSPNAVPTTLVLDGEGRVAGRIVGVIQVDVLDAMIARLVAEMSQ